ncbi:hypothetical protein [Qiania dongpingensis]|uniref:Uncharacterized protein n=1 Tax=Qiania dongpingensis TaxID=2763669 RepID=A0A7G9G2V6_9FIRM|nr:hypothetical protein [Qiania dongpingensis]QNM05138.1 hypothetical protein H9Q78_11910 [Qiania dongpingensis]
MADGPPNSALVFILIFASQVLQLCRSATFFFYGLFSPELAVWTDIVGFGVLSALLTCLLAVFCCRLYQKLDLHRVRMAGLEIHAKEI